MPSYYLTEEAREKRMAKLVEKIATEPETVPVSVRRIVAREIQIEQREAA